ncbi:coenzyme Q-binding protein COQ10 homolog B, mitochondrial [Agrilus planipennis]|uniref:Coenzyme Q-binding protein COQ10 homolog B, mitochondrial n=1 Tax=Agrilus planipennis TaxID=224129 RepID=A0A1W4X023_AGRPL|nr:coenzyme Q-binding protein COQ10 homolog B, mitochondrial [Agrilus planipennis]
MSKPKPFLRSVISPGTAQSKNIQWTVFVRNFYDLYSKRKEYKDRKLIGFSGDQMYEVVADVANYKDFLPFCRKSIIIEHNPDKFMKAKLEIGFPPVIESYTSHVTLVKPHLVKAMNRDAQLFDYLKTTWKFSPGLKSNPQSCIIDFHVCFQFKSIFHSNLAHMFFDKVVKQMEGAFFKEAARRYGRASLPSHRLSATASEQHS